VATAKRNTRQLGHKLNLLNHARNFKRRIPRLFDKKIVGKSFMYFLTALTTVSGIIIYFGIDIKKEAEKSFTKADSVQRETQKAQEVFNETLLAANQKVTSLDGMINIQKDQVSAFSLLPKQYGDATIDFISNLQKMQVSTMDSLIRRQVSLEELAKKTQKSLENVGELNNAYKEIIDENKNIVKGYESKFNDQSKIIAYQVEDNRKLILQKINEETLSFTEDSKELQYSKVCNCILAVKIFRGSMKHPKVSIEIFKNNTDMKQDLIGEFDLVKLKPPIILKVNNKNIAFTLISALYSKDNSSENKLYVTIEVKETALP